jgi:hypothetical protein
MGACFLESLPPSPVITDRRRRRANSEPSDCALCQATAGRIARPKPCACSHWIRRTEACSVALLWRWSHRRFAEGGKSHAQQILGMVMKCWRGGLSLCPCSTVLPPASVRAPSPACGSAWRWRRAWPSARICAWPRHDLEALGAAGAGGPGRSSALACLDARMGEVYWGCFAADARAGLIATASRAWAPASCVHPAERRDRYSRHRPRLCRLSGARGAAGLEPSTRAPPRIAERARDSPGSARCGWPCRGGHRSRELRPSTCAIKWP